jgi:hypothetical protein
MYEDIKLFWNNSSNILVSTRCRSVLIQDYEFISKWFLKKGRRACVGLVQLTENWAQYWTLGHGNKPPRYMKGGKYSDQFGDRLFFNMNTSNCCECGIQGFLLKQFVTSIFSVAYRENMRNNVPSFGNKYLHLI